MSTSGMPTCDFCHAKYEGNHMCSCKECDKKHPICNACFDYYVSIGKIEKRSSYGDLDKLT